MNTVPLTTLNLAQQLVTLEAGRDPSAGMVSEAARACDRLRVPLAKLAGVAGFRSLLKRAMALATAKVPWLSSVQVREDGSLQGFEAVAIPQGTTPDLEAGVIIVAQLLGLLNIFIGEPLTLRLVRDAWPDSQLDETVGEGEGQI